LDRLDGGDEAVQPRAFRDGSARSDAECRPSVSGGIYDYLGRTQEFWPLYQNGILDRLGIHANREAIKQQLQSVFDDPSAVRLYPEVRQVLENLRGRGFYLGIISNNHDGLLPILKRFRLDHQFDGVTYSQQVGAEKPDPRVFHLWPERAGCLPEESLHVGDSWESDYVGALSVGMMAVWLNRTGLPAPKACHQIRNLEELDPLLSAPR
jgi:putative hydrolase of the HAD superfamily